MSYKLQIVIYSDISVLDNIVPDDIEIGNLYRDRAYYSINKLEELKNKGMTPIISPPKNAKIHDKASAKYHDKIVKYIERKGSIYAFFKRYGYGERELVESQISRIKRCIGSTLLTQKTTSQKTEGIIIPNIINFWNSLGKC